MKCMVGYFKNPNLERISYITGPKKLIYCEKWTNNVS